MKSKDSHTEPVDLMTDMLNEPHQITVADTYEPNVDVVLFDGDCGEFLKDIPSNSVDLIITSPPYNIGKKYEKKNNLTFIPEKSRTCNCRITSSACFYWKSLLASRKLYGLHRYL